MSYLNRLRVSNWQYKYPFSSTWQISRVRSITPYMDLRLDAWDKIDHISWYSTIQTPYIIYNSWSFIYTSSIEELYGYYKYLKENVWKYIGNETKTKIYLLINLLLKFRIIKLLLNGASWIFLYKFTKSK